MLNGSNEEFLGVLQEDEGESSDSNGAITDQLLVDESVICWTCGSEVEQEAIETTLDRLRGLRKDKLNEANSIEDQLDELQQ